MMVTAADTHTENDTRNDDVSHAVPALSTIQKRMRITANEWKKRSREQARRRGREGEAGDNWIELI